MWKVEEGGREGGVTESVSQVVSSQGCSMVPSPFSTETWGYQVCVKFRLCQGSKNFLLAWPRREKCFSFIIINNYSIIILKKIIEILIF